MLYATRWLLPLLAVLQLYHVAILADDTPISLCGNFTSWNSSNPAHPYSFIPNAWGADGTGGSCLNVTDDGAAWTLKYKWAGTPTLVKQYAHMKVWPSNLPVRISNISHLLLKGTWSTLIDGTQNDNTSTQALALEANVVRSNVAIDMFLSTDPLNSTGLNPPIEIMIWPWYSPYVKPLGWSEINPNAYVESVAGTNFSLFHGYNDGGQHVFSWLAHQNLTSTDADYAPLIKYIYEKGLLSGDLWLGQLELGTEILHTDATTIFSLSNYNLQLIRKGDPGESNSTSVNVTTTMAPNTTRTTAPAIATASATSKSGSSSVYELPFAFGVMSGFTIFTALIYMLQLITS